MRNVYYNYSKPHSKLLPLGAGRQYKLVHFLVYYEYKNVIMNNKTIRRREYEKSKNRRQA